MNLKYFTVSLESVTESDFYSDQKNPHASFFVQIITIVS